jgi:hypothetical protein
MSREGKLNIAGEFNSFFTRTLPLVWPHMVIVARLEANVSEGLEHAVQIKLTDLDGAILLQSPPLPVRFGSAGRGIPARADVLIELSGVLFPVYGDYSVGLFVDGVHRDDLTLYVRDVPALPNATPA